MKKLKDILLLGFGHFVVDGACAAIYFGSVHNLELSVQLLAVLVIGYNLLAFAFEVPIGIISDHFKRPKLTAMIGILLVIFGALLSSNGILCILFIGLGNAVYHVGGGTISLEMDQGKATLPGIFVAPGAIGLLLGGFFGNSEGYSLIIIIAILVLIIFTTSRVAIYKYEENDKARTKNPLVIIIAIFLVVLFRGLIGSMLIYTWKSDQMLLILLVSFIVFGKSIGGVLADRFGFMIVGMLGLIVALITLPLGFNNYILGMIGALAFNITMPITVTVLGDMMPRNKGFAFGLTTLALISGVYPSYVLNYKGLSNYAVVIPIILSTIILYIGLNNYKNSTRLKGDN